MLVLKSLVFPLCLLLSSGACNPKQDPTRPRRAETLTAATIVEMDLTYMCGNTFRVRNPNAEEVAGSWDVYNTAQTGSLTLPPKPAEAPHSETYFTTVNRGTVRLFYNGQLIQTKANGSKPPCQSGTVPVIPDHPDYPDDSLYVMSAPNAPTVVYYRRLMTLAFLESATTQDIVNFFQKYAAQVVGGVPGMGEYYIQVADPGPTWSKVDSLVNAMNSEPGVDVVAQLIREMPKGGEGVQRDPHP